MSFEVVPEELKTHAGHLDGLTDRLNTAVDAAKTVSMSDSAYGLICQFVPPFINPMEQKAQESLRAAVEGMTTTADNVRTAASMYQETEEAHKRPFTALDDTMSEQPAAS